VFYRRVKGKGGPYAFMDDRPADLWTVVAPLDPPQIGPVIARPDYLHYNMHMFEQISSLEILKWVALVFLAGFIGFFGKYLGRVVISIFEKKHDDSPFPGQAARPDAADAQVKPGGSERVESSVSRDEQKLVKKALKAEAKAKKKLDK